MLTKNLALLTIGTLMIACSLTQPRRKLNRQVIPKELLNSQWTLETYYKVNSDGLTIQSHDKADSDCSVTIQFLEKGQLTFTIQGHQFKGYNLWYLVKDSIIEFHPGIIEKFAWPSYNCDPKPDTFARDLLSMDKVLIHDKKMTLLPHSKKDKRKLVFKKV